MATGAIGQTPAERVGGGFRGRTNDVPRLPLVARLVLGGAAAVAAALEIGALVRLYAQVGERADYWSQPRGGAGGLVYAALGDSAAQGIGASRVERGYVGQLAGRLRLHTGLPVRIVNLSRSSATVSDVVETQLPALKALSPVPDLITVAVGGNDLRRWTTPGFARSVEQLVSALPADRTVVADVPYFMHGGLERQAAAAAALLHRRAEAHDLVVADLHEAMRAQGWRAMLTNFAADWFHPDDRGHAVWTSAFWAALASRPDRFGTFISPSGSPAGRSDRPRGLPRTTACRA